MNSSRFSLLHLITSSICLVVGPFALGKSLEDVLETRFYMRDGEAVILEPSQRYLVADQTNFAGIDLDNTSFRVADSYVLSKKEVVLIVRNAETDAETFVSMARTLRDSQALGNAFAAGETDLVLVNEFVMRFRSSQAADEIIAASGAGILRHSKVYPDRYLVEFPGLSPSQALDSFNRISEGPGVIVAYPNFVIVGPGSFSEHKDEYAKSNFEAESPGPTGIREAHEAPEQGAASAEIASWPNDQKYVGGQQFTGLGLINAAAAWETTIGGCNARIAVLDDGIDMTHPDLDDKIIDSWDVIDDDIIPEHLDEQAHGTQVAGVVGAETNNQGIGIAGTIWGGSIIPIRIYAGHEGEILQPYTVMQALAKVIEFDARIINNSWGMPPSNETALLFSDVSSLITAEVENGRLFVFAAGNGSGAAEWPASMAATSDVVSVGSTNTDGIVLPNSKSGPDAQSISLVGPGRSIVSTDPVGLAGQQPAVGEAGDYYPAFEDSSAAAPFVSGAAGLLLSWDPDATPAQLKEWLMGGAKDPDTDIDNLAWGAGLLDVKASLDLVGTDGLSVRGSLLPTSALLNNESAVLTLTLTRNDSPISGAIVKLQATDSNLLSILPGSTPLVTDCNGQLVTTVTSTYPGATPQLTSVAVTVSNFAANIPVAVGGHRPLPRTLVGPLSLSPPL